jgi:NAD(P)-dependent dehydrogenase (short-subunit alcohol dehydrogenase family)
VVHASKLFDLSDKVAIVTGGSRGLGKEMAVALSEMGAKVVITARREEWLTPTYQEFQKQGAECLAVKADIAKPDDVQRIVAETLKLWGKVDILVNNAGMTWGTPPEDMPLEKWDDVLNTNARGTLICCQMAGREMMRQGGGNIINIASTTGALAVDPRIMQAIGYQASKAAIIVLTKQLAVEWAKHNIRVNAIAPFFFRTRMAEGVIERAESVMIQHVPMGRLANEGEMKGVVVFLASQASSYITGQVFNIDGGLSAW